MIDTTLEETYEDGQTIFKEGDCGDWVYYVESGAVQLSRYVDGKKRVIAVVREGEIFGELAFIAGYPRTATAEALGTTVLGIVDRKVLDDEYNRLSGSFRLLVKSLAKRLKKTTDAVIGQPECRREDRFCQSLSVTFKTTESLAQALSHNISGSGMFIKTPRPLDKGQIFELEIQLPDGMFFKAEATVMWVRSKTQDPVNRPVGMGVKFRPKNEEDRIRLENVIQGKLDPET